MIIFWLLGNSRIINVDLTVHGKVINTLEALLSQNYRTKLDIQIIYFD